MSSKRERELADFGEVRACQLLRQEGFVVERMPRNFHFFDLMATRGSCRLLVPVKTRNKTTSKGTPKLNAYSLYEKRGHYAAAKKIADFAGAKFFGSRWLSMRRQKPFRLTCEMLPNCPHQNVSQCTLNAICPTISPW
jgi:hypothetical protein